MTALQIVCLGDFQVTLNGTALTTFQTDKSRALLAYLAIEGREHQRTKLAQFLWPGYGEESARNSLRQVLYQLRQLLPAETKAGAPPPWLVLTRQTVQLNPAAPITVDVVTFTHLLAECAAHPHRDLSACVPCLTRLRQAVELYQGDFLSKLGVVDSDEFEEWRRITQEQLHIQMLNALTHLSAAAEATGDDEGAIQTAHRLLTLEPWLEAAHRQIMRLLAQRGQRAAALAQYQRCRQVLAEELGIEPDDETTALYEQIRSSQFQAQRVTAPVIAPPALEQPTAPVKPVAWLAQLPPLLGRADELAHIAALLKQPTCRLVTLVGPPGVGKTRLAQAVLTASHFEHGGYFIELAALRDPTLLAVTIAHALNAAHPTQQFTGERLIERLRDQALLLVLDNFEQVLPGVTLVDELLTHCPRLKVLLTSRAPLHLDGEQVITVNPLPLPVLTAPKGHPPQGALDLATVAHNAAVQLFCQRAAAVVPGFALTERLAPVIVEICRRLDGLPLAIELAAAHSRLLPPPALLERLTQRLELLASRSQARPERQQTLRAAIAWSYELLNAEEQRLFRQLSVFVSGATLSAIEAVVSSGSTPRALLGGLEALLDKSLLRQAELPPVRGESEQRVLMLETLREYGGELLTTAEAGDPVTSKRHADYFLKLAETTAPKLHGPDQVAWLDRLALDHDNLRAALAWFVQAGEVHKALRLATALRYFWRVRGHYREGCERLLHILTQPEAAPTGGPTDAVRARALNAAGYLQWVQGNTTAAQPLLQEALTLGRTIADAASTAFALRYLGLAADARQEHTNARQYLEESLALYRTLDTPNETALALMYLGEAAFSQQAYDEAQRLYQESAELLRQLGNNVVLPYALRHLGYLALARGNLNAALRLSTESLQLNLAAGEQQGSAAAVAALAAVAAAGERWAQAARLLAAVTTWLGASGTQLLPLDRTYYEQTQRLLQQQLQQGTSLPLPTTAERLSLEQALAYVRQELTVDDEPGRPGDKVTSDKVTSTSSVTQSPPHPVTLSPSHPLTPSSVPSHNLPAASTAFIGRTHSLAEIVSRLQTARLLTLVGPGGMGKTRLAVEVGRERLVAFADGVWFVPLAAISTPAALAGAIATALGIAFQGGDPRGTLLQSLRPKHLLLILDNFEQLLPTGAGSSPDALDLLADLLEVAPKVQVLVTSRQRLNLRSEQIYAVPALSFAATATLAEAAALAAVRLFVQAVQRVQADFQLTEANLAAVLRICQLVQGMPLGLELAAAHADELSLPALANAVAHSAEFLTVDWQDMPERQRSMRAVFAWSWRLLPPEEQRALRQLSSFRGGFDRTAAQAVTGATHPVLTHLIHKSLLQWQDVRGQSSRGALGGDGRGEERYLLHELLRQFAAEELNAAGERAAVEEQHSRYYLAYLAARGLRLGRCEPKEASAEIQAEVDNIRLAWQWAATQGRLADLDQAVYAWWQFCRFQGLEGEGRQSFAAAIAGVRQRLSATTLDDTTGLLGKRLLARLLAIHANFLYVHGRNEEMTAHASEAIDLGRASGDVAGETFGTFVLGRAAQEAGQLQKADTLWRQTIELVQRYQSAEPENEFLHDAHWMALHALRVNAVNFGDYAGSRAYMMQALQICQALGKRQGELLSLSRLAQTNFLLYDFAAAEAGWRAALDLARALGFRRVAMLAQEGLGGVARLRGDYMTARRLLEQAVTLATELAAPYEEAAISATLIRLYTHLGDQAAAEQRYTQLTQLLARVQLIKESQLYFHLAAAVKAHVAGARQEAIRHAEEANQLIASGDILFRVADTTLILGHTRAALGQWEAAATAFHQALNAFQQFTDAPWAQALAAEPQAGLAQITLAQGQLTDALAYVEVILPLLAEQPRAGFNDPYYVYLVGYRVLAARNDPRAAPLLQQGYDLLQQDARALDTENRQHFLTAVPIHRDLVAAYNQLDKGTRREGDKEKKSSNQPVTANLGPASPLYNLPMLLPTLIGRERELAEIATALQQSTVRMLTLAGPGGMGKTRLALATAAQVAPHFTAGVCLVELAELTEPTLLPQTVAAALGQTELAEAEAEDPVARYLGDKPLLLVLDNCEHVDKAVAYWSKRWLSACPRLRILATSHGALTVPGEVVWPIPTLAYPPATTLEADQLLTYGAVQLFVARAREVKPDFALTAANGAAIAEICRRLEGIPLALELAAARVRSLTPTEIAVRLNKGIHAALANNRSAPARHQTMQAALDWSFASLDADEQLLFQQLAVFTGGFTLPAIEIVTQLPDALDLLERLIDRALVITETLGEQTRYRLLDVIRKYADDKLSASGLAPALHQRHAAYFLQRAESAQMDPQADGEALWLQPEAENLSGAVDWSLTNSAASSAVRLAGALTWYWWMRGYLRAQRTPLQQALAYLESANQQQAAARDDDRVEPAMRALAAGALFALWEELDKASLAFTQALALAEAEQNQHLVGLALRRLATVAIQQKAYGAANAFIERGLAVWQALGGIWHVAWLYAHQGDLADERGDQTQAWLAYEASTRLPVNPGARAYPLRRMAYLALARGNRSQALALCRESLQLNLASGDRQGIAACLVGVARFTVEGAQILPQAAGLPLLRRAAELLGAVAALLQTVEGRLLRADEVAYHQTAHLLQEQLAAVAPPAYQAALAAGRALTIEQATALALQEEALTPPVAPFHPQETASLQRDKVTRWQGGKVPESPPHPLIPSSPQLVTPSPLLDWAEMPMVDFFVERQTEVAQVRAWVTPAAADGIQARLVSILGMGGMGKTTLAAVVTKAVAPEFAVVIWRSLLNAPPLSELLHNWLQTLSHQTLTVLPESIDEQLRLLLTYLQQQRCLLVLDNVESIFVADTLAPEGSVPPQSRAGVTRPGYEGYDQLFQRLASSEHQSCLLLTSREQPYALLRSGRQAQMSGRVQVLPLAGLDQQAGYALLQSNGLHTSAAEAAQLVKNYSGNPLALQIVAATIADFFGGDVAAFQQEEGQLFDGMRLVLDQQFARLSPLEREILIWLAIEREPVTVPLLRSNFVQPIATAPFLEALQALQNRSLLEKRDTGLTLQNVITEYTTNYLIEQVCQEITELRVTNYELRKTSLDEELVTRNSQLVTSFFNRFALLKAQAKAYVRQSQARLILQPVAQQLLHRWGQAGLLTRSRELLHLLRKQAPRTPGYAAGNLLNLLLALGIDLTDYDFSNLCVWQPYLRETTLPQINFTNADLRGATFTDTFDIVRALAYSPDGRVLAAGTSDGEIRLWRASDGQLLANVKGHGDIVGWLGFLDDGKTLISYSHDLALAMWQVGPDVTDGVAGEAGEVVTLQLLYRNIELSNLTNLVAFHPQDELLAFGTERGWLCLWHLGTRHQRSEQILTIGQLHTLRFSPDGKTLAIGASDRRLHLWDVDAAAGHLTLRQSLAETPAVARDISFRPDGRTLATGHEDGSIRLWALDAAGYCTTGQAVQVLSGHRAGVWRLAFSPDGQLLASGSDDQSVRLWAMGGLPAAVSAQPLARFDDHRGWVRALAFSPDGSALASAGADLTLRVWDLRRAQLLYTLYGHVKAVKSIAFVPNSRLLVSGSDDQRVRLWDVADGGRCLQTWAGHTGFIWQVAVSPDGRLVASAGDDRQIYVRDAGSGQVLQILSGHDGGATAVAFSPDSKLLASGGMDCRVMLWDVRAPWAPAAGRGTLIRTWNGGTQVVWAVAFSSDGEYLAFGGEPNRVRIWHLPSQQFYPALENETGVLRTLAFSPDSRWLAAAGHDAILYLWQVGSAAPPILIAGHQHRIRSVAFSPDGRRLATASFDQTVRLWDLQNQTQIRTLPGHSNQVLAVAFSADGTLLASASEDETIRLWHGETGALLSVLPIPGPYSGMKIDGVTGISEAQKAALKVLGAVDTVEDDTVTSDTVTRWQGEGVTSTSSVTPSPPHLLTSSPPHLVTPSPLYDWDEMPVVDFFTGRTAEMAQLTAWLTPGVKGDKVPARLISVLGMGGMGKTTLAAAVTKAVAPTFAVVIWRSLLNAPPLNELLSNWLQLLARQTLTTLPEALDEQLRMLMDYLSAERCLLVLDNVESIFTDDDPHRRAGATRPGYEGYEQLFLRLGSGEHQSCLLLTSREQPYALVRSGRQVQEGMPVGRIRTLSLAGLNPQAASELLRSNGLQTSELEAASLIDSYSGNPLALQIVAATIADFFGGDIAAFQQEGGLFDGIRLVLEQQIARLSALERDLLIWLAIERAAIPVQILRANFVQPRSTSELLEALQALQNRSLLEKRDTGLTLQNVIIEYTTHYLIERVCEEILDFGFLIAEHNMSAAESKIQNSFLNRFALLKAQSKAYLRQSQSRLIVQPIGDRLTAQLGKTKLITLLQRLIGLLQTSTSSDTGYAAGNLLNLLVQLRVDLHGYDFSRLTIRQADLQGTTLTGVSLAYAKLQQCAFTNTFGAILAVAVSPDHRLLAAASNDGVVRLWQLSDNQLYAICEGHTNVVRDVAFSPDGRWLASASLDQTVRLWEVATGQIARVLEGHSAGVYCITFCGNGTLIASGSRDGKIQLWDRNSGRRVRVWHEHTDAIQRLVAAPGGTRLASSSADQTIRLWDIETEQSLALLRGHTQNVSCLAFSPDGTLLASGSADQTIRLWDMATGVTRHVLHGHAHWLRAVTFSPDGALLASGSADQTVRLWDANSGQVRGILQGHTNAVWALAFTADSKRLISGGTDHQLRVWDVRNPADSRTIHTIQAHVGAVLALAVSHDGRLIATGEQHKLVRVWEVASGKQVCTLAGHTDIVTSVAFSPDSHYLVSTGDDGVVRLWDIAQRREVKTLMGHLHQAHRVAYHPHGTLIASSGHQDAVRLWELHPPAAGRLRRLLMPTGADQESAYGIAFSPDGCFLAGTYGGDRLCVWDVSSQQYLYTLHGHQNGLEWLAWSPNGILLASSDVRGNLYVWDTRAPALMPIRHFATHTYPWHLAFSPDSRLLASVGEDPLIRLWDIESSACVQTFSGHTQNISSVAFLPDGETLVSGSFDGTIRFWAVHSGTLLTTWHIPGPYAGLNITGVTGITDAQKTALRALGAVEE